MNVKLHLNKKYVVVITGLIIIGVMTSEKRGYFSPGYGATTDTGKWPKSFGFGSTASPQDIVKLDIDVRPDGKGLPAGAGDAAQGKAIYVVKCAACHGATGLETPGIKLMGPALVSDTAAASKPKTIGNYWPYATTLFDYMRRTMPYTQPGSLTDNEVYSLTAFLLSANKIIRPETVLNAQNLWQIEMPAKKLFIVDDRKGGPEVK
ncbi:cytochrome c [Mucilaginibacter sp.]|uniref:c-type cytochrome n=1 Tax=Mucilaginibacter sp. TaxID=1882438 RepID=UPI0025D75E14|nr:cytochrome c [Mucilaginibacter sp.]